MRSSRRCLKATGASSFAAMPPASILRRAPAPIWRISRGSPIAVPLRRREVERLDKLVASAQEERNDASSKPCAFGVEAILVSPNFLFRIERDPNPDDPAAVHPVNDYELASRLSYFLWSSMPDERSARRCRPEHSCTNRPF